MKFLDAVLCGAFAVTLGAAGAARAETNVVPAHWTSITTTGVNGVLRAGSPWGPNSTPSDPLLPVDGLFAPEQTQWDHTSFWWDADPSVNPTDEVTYVIRLDAFYTLDRFVVQADDNDTYRLDWWDGAAWQTAWNIPTLPSFGLRTRDSGAVAAITTDQLRFVATGGDNYYGVSEIQAFGQAAVPEPAAWTMMVAGLGVGGAILRRRRSTIHSDVRAAG